MRLKKYIGDRAFYAMALSIAVPIMIQNGITNFVSLLDNIMVGSLGQDQMSGVSIVNQLLFVFNLCVFGAMGGAGIFGAQFAGSGNEDGLRSTTQYKLVIGALLLGVGLIVLTGGGDWLINLYLHEDGGAGSIVSTMDFGRQYLNVMLFGLAPFMLIQVYASTLRETGQTRVPMVAGIVAVLVNLTLNYLLIFGKAGFAPMGVRGAALATVISRFVELGIVAGYTHLHADEHPFAHKLYRKWHIGGALAKKITLQGMPLMINELLWSSGMAFMSQCYSTRGLDAVASINISSTICNLFSVTFFALGMSVGIIVGQLLGAGRMEEARQTDTRLIAFSTAVSVGVAIILIIVAPLFPHLYRTEASVRAVAASLIRTAAICMPFDAFANATYFTLRSGGKSGITFVFDSGFMWVIAVPTAFLCSRLTGIGIVPLFAICQAINFIKDILGFVMVKQGRWINNLVA